VAELVSMALTEPDPNLGLLCEPLAVLDSAAQHSMKHRPFG
jgi:hypothetical protein